MIPRRLRGLLGHRISQNVLALYGMQAATFVVPLLTLPYVSRVLGPSAFGLVLFSQSFSIFLTLFVDWGFTPFGVWTIAAEREDMHAVEGTVARIRTAQLLMVAFSIPVAIACLALIPKFTHHPGFLALAWLAAVTTALMPNWFFVGTERVRLTATIQLGFRAIGAALTFVLVQNRSDAWIVMALYTMTSIGMWIVSDALVYRRVRFRLCGIRAGLVAIRESGRVFVGTVGVSLLSTFNVVLLGLFVPSAQVAQYATGERIVRTWEQVLGPIGTAVTPRMAFLQVSNRPDRARRLWRIAMVVIGGAGLFVAVILGVFAPLWIRIIFGPKYVEHSAPILRILVLLIPANIVGYLTIVWLIPQGRDRTVLNIATAAGVLNVALGCTLVPLIGPEGMAWSVVTAQMLAACALVVAVYRIRDPDKALFRHGRGANGHAPPAWDPGGDAADQAEIPAEEAAGHGQPRSSGALPG
jgi:polysaccharide transporter, PST family